MSFSKRSSLPVDSKSSGKDDSSVIKAGNTVASKRISTTPQTKAISKDSDNSNSDELKQRSTSHLSSTTKVKTVDTNLSTSYQKTPISAAKTKLTPATKKMASIGNLERERLLKHAKISPSKQSSVSLENSDSIQVVCRFRPSRGIEMIRSMVIDPVNNSVSIIGSHDTKQFAFDKVSHVQFFSMRQLT